MTKKPQFIRFVFAIFVAIFTLFLMQQDPMKDIESVTYDTRARLKASTVKPSEEILLIGIDEKDLLTLRPKFGGWPWPRWILASVIDHCREARVVAPDIVFAGESSPVQEADANQPMMSPEDHLRENGRVPLNRQYGDWWLTHEVGGNTNVVNAVYCHGYDGYEEDTPAGDRFFLDRFEAEPSEFLGMSLPFPELLEASERIGYVNFIRRDRDGKARSLKVALNVEGRVLPSFSLAIVMQALGLKNEDVRTRGDTFLYGDLRMPLNKDGSFHLNWRSDASGGGYQVIPFTDVFLSLAEGKENFAKKFPDREFFPRSYFKDKIVVIGSTSDDLLRDMERTPIGKEVGGCVIHATAIDNLLNMDRIHMSPFWRTIILVFVFALLPVFFSRAHPWQLLFVLLGGLVLLTLLSVIAILVANHMIPVFGPALALLLTTFSLVVSNWRQEAASRESLEEMEKVKQGFTDMLVHDLKNTVAPVVMSLELVRKNPDSSFVRDEFPYYVEQTYNQLLLQVNSLLDIRKMEEGKMKLRRSPNCLLQMMYSVQSEYRMATQRMDLDLVIEEGPEAHQVFLLDEIVMRRVLENLIWNAVKYASVGSVIHFYCGMPSASTFEFKITNDCRPIPAHRMREIFGAFVVGESQVTVGKISSTGLGLGFCKLAIEGHNGTIQLHSPAPGRDDGFQVHCTLLDIEIPRPIVEDLGDRT